MNAAVLSLPEIDPPSAVQVKARGSPLGSDCPAKDDRCISRFQVLVETVIHWISAGNDDFNTWTVTESDTANPPFIHHRASEKEGSRRRRSGHRNVAFGSDQDISDSMNRTGRRSPCRRPCRKGRFPHRQDQSIQCRYRLDPRRKVTDRISCIVIDHHAIHHGMIEVGFDVRTGGMRTAMTGLSAGMVMVTLPEASVMMTWFDTAS